MGSILSAVFTFRGFLCCCCCCLRQNLTRQSWLTWKSLMQTGLASNSQLSSCLHFLCAEITAVQHHALQLMRPGDRGQYLLEFVLLCLQVFIAAAIALTDLEITMQTWLTLNLQRSSCFGFLSDEITGVHHYVVPPLPPSKKEYFKGMCSSHLQKPCSPCNKRKKKKPPLNR